MMCMRAIGSLPSTRRSGPGRRSRRRSRPRCGTGPPSRWAPGCTRPTAARAREKRAFCAAMISSTAGLLMFSCASMFEQHRRRIVLAGGQRPGDARHGAWIGFAQALREQRKALGVDQRGQYLDVAERLLLVRGRQRLDDRFDGAAPHARRDAQGLCAPPGSAGSPLALISAIRRSAFIVLRKLIRWGTLAAGSALCHKDLH